MVAFKESECNKTTNYAVGSATSSLLLAVGGDGGD